MCVSMRETEAVVSVTGAVCATAAFKMVVIFFPPFSHSVSHSDTMC